MGSDEMGALGASISVANAIESCIFAGQEAALNQSSIIAIESIWSRLFSPIFFIIRTIKYIAVEIVREWKIGMDIGEAGG